jgi:hypothetical protein
MLEANTRAAHAENVTRDEIQFERGERTYWKLYSIIFNDTASIDKIVYKNELNLLTKRIKKID